MSIYSVLKHPLFKSGFIYTISEAINKAVPFFILPILSYFLLPSDYGIVANYGVLVSIVSIFVLLGINGVISVNYYKLSKQELSGFIFNGLFLILLSSVVIAIIVLLAHEFIFSLIKVPVKYQLLAVGMAFASAITGVNLALWRLEEQALKFGFYQVSQTAINAGLSVFFVVLLELGWIGRISGMILASLSFGLLSMVLIYRRGYINFRYNKKFLVAILSFGIPLIPHSLSVWLRSGVDRVFISKFVGEAATGLYSTGFQFGILVSFLTMSFNNAFVPYMYRLLSEEDSDKLVKNKAKLRKVILYGLGALLVLCILLTFFSKLLLQYFFSDKYLDASRYIFWAILSQTFQGMYLFFVNYIFFVKKTKGLAIITFTCALFQVALSYILIIQIGAIGAAYATAIVSLINFVLVAWYSNRVYPMGWLLDN